MNKTKTKRLSAQDMRKLLLKNANILMSDKYRTSAPELLQGFNKKGGDNMYFLRYFSEEACCEIFEAYETEEDLLGRVHQLHKKDCSILDVIKGTRLELETVSTVVEYRIKES